MSAERRERLDAGADPSVDVSLPSGSLRVEGGEAGVVAVEIHGPHADRFVVERRGGAVVVAPERGNWTRWRAHDVVVSVPAGTDVRARLASADCDVATAVASLEVDTAAGEVRAGDVAGDLRVKSASAGIRVGRVAGAVSVTSASGSVTLEAAGGPVRTHTASGDLRVARAGALVKARTASGDIAVERYDGADLECATMSGDVRVTLAAGRLLDLDLYTMSGEIRSDFDVGDDAAGDDAGEAGEPGRIEIRSMSGDIALRAARP